MKTELLWIKCVNCSTQITVMGKYSLIFVEISYDVCSLSNTELKLMLPLPQIRHKSCISIKVNANDAFELFEKIFMAWHSRCSFNSPLLIVTGALKHQKQTVKGKKAQFCYNCLSSATQIFFTIAV